MNSLSILERIIHSRTDYPISYLLFLIHVIVVMCFAVEDISFDFAVTASMFEAAC